VNPNELLAHSRSFSDEITTTWRRAPSCHLLSAGIGGLALHLHCSCRCDAAGIPMPNSPVPAATVTAFRASADLDDERGER
jgi:hypothetical protein